LITTREIFYFIIIIALFLSLCIVRMKNSRESNSLYKNTSRYALLIVFALFFGYVSSRPGKIGYLDMTSTKSRTLTAASQEIAAQIDGPLEITTYVNLLDQNVYFGLPQSRNSDLAQFEKFQRFIPGIRMKYVYYYDVTDLNNNSNMTYQGDLTGLSVKQIAEKVADNMGLDLDLFMPPEKIRKLIDLSSENNSLVRVLRYKGKESRLRFYSGVDQFPAEREIAAAIKRLIVPVPQIAFITGNQERSIRKTGERNYELMSSMKRSRTALINQGFDILDLDLKTTEIPTGLSALVLADPSQPVDLLAQQKIAAYIAAGGNMLITTEPGRGPVINPILQMFGAALLPGTLLHPTKNDAPDLLFGQLTRSGGTVAMPGAAALKADPTGNFIADTLIQSDKSGWITPGVVVDVTKTDIAYQPQQGDRKGIFPIALALHRKSGNKDQLILVSGDADFMSNGELANPRADNEFLVKNMFKWFSNDAFPIEIVRKAPADDNILLSRRQLSTWKGVLIGLIPVLVILLGGVILMRRKNN